jgi:hypothetical protein
MHAKRKAIAAESSKPLRGRPTKYRPEMCDRVIELMRHGASKAQICADPAIDISYETCAEWCNPMSPQYSIDFSNAVKRGNLLSEAWWTKHAQDHLIDMPGEGKFNTALWFINMKNRFGWRDQVDHNVSGTIKVTHEQALDALIGKPLEAITVEHERITDH